MDTSKVYFDSEGNECSIWRMVKREPTWAAVRIQEGEKAIDEITTLRQQLAESEARVVELEGLIYRKCEHFILRKQAEAVEAAKHEHALTARIPDGTTGEHFQDGFDTAAEQYDASLDRYAQRLRQQADEAERAGGEQ